MNNETIAAADFQRKPYAMPRIKVAVIKRTNIINTSGRSLNPYQGDEWSDD